MGDLPQYCFQPHRPFSNVGMDYEGPFIVKEGRRRMQNIKGLFSTFCVYVSHGHTSRNYNKSKYSSFFTAPGRFVARRGIPNDIFSDCGTNYVGVTRNLKELFYNIDT